MQKNYVDISCKTSYPFSMIKQRYKKFFTIVLMVLSISFGAIQFIPSSFSRNNPPVTGEPKWDSPQTRSAFFTSCADCHSNESKFPWYSTIAPVSWMIESDIKEGRKHFNISEWDRSERGGDDAAEQVQKGAMPIGPYLFMHPETNLNVKEKKVFVEGLMKTFGGQENNEKEEKE